MIFVLKSIINEINESESLKQSISLYLLRIELTLIFVFQTPLLATEEYDLASKQFTLCQANFFVIA